MSFWVYILECADGSYYTGHTDDLKKRVSEHSSGSDQSCFTFSRRPLELVYSQEFATREEALNSERQLKGWSRAKKAALIRGDWSLVSDLARSSFDKLRTNGAIGDRANGTVDSGANGVLK